MASHSLIPIKSSAGPGWTEIRSISSQFVTCLGDDRIHRRKMPSGGKCFQRGGKSFSPISQWGIARSAPWIFHAHPAPPRHTRCWNSSLISTSILCFLKWEPENQQLTSSERWAKWIACLLSPIKAERHLHGHYIRRGKMDDGEREDGSPMGLALIALKQAPYLLSPGTWRILITGYKQSNIS